MSHPQVEAFTTLFLSDWLAGFVSFTKLFYFADFHPPRNVGSILNSLWTRTIGVTER